MARRSGLSTLVGNPVPAALAAANLLVFQLPAHSPGEQPGSLLLHRVYQRATGSVAAFRTAVLCRPFRFDFAGPVLHVGARSGTGLPGVSLRSGIARRS